MNNTIKDCSIKVIPDNYKELSELIGIENLLKLADNYGGTMVYIPLRYRITRLERDTRIRKEFNGGNYRELARKYNVCESTIRTVVNSNEKRGGNKNK